MEKLKINISRCKGCHICVSVCKKGAISIAKEMSAKVYHTIEVDEEKCVQCGACYKMCPDYVFEIL